MRSYPKCANCGRDMRPKGSRLEDHPRTVALVSALRCLNCYRSGNVRGASTVVRELSPNEVKVVRLVCRRRMRAADRARVLSMLGLVTS